MIKTLTNYLSITIYLSVFAAMILTLGIIIERKTDGIGHTKPRVEHIAPPARIGSVARMKYVNASDVARYLPPISYARLLMPVRGK